MGFQEKMLEHSGKIWFPVAVGALHALDTFVPVVPNDVLVVAAVLAKPKRWVLVAVIQTLGCLVGCMAFAGLAMYNPQAIKGRYPSLFESDSWAQTDRFFRTYGPAASLVGAGVFPVHPFLFVGVFTGVPVGKLLASIALGRLVRNLLICVMAAEGDNIRKAGMDMYDKLMAQTKRKRKSRTE